VKPKHQRLVLALVALVALIGAGLLAASALREEVSYFYTPVTLAKAKVTVRFAVLDRDASQAVVYKGITPDLFVEGSGVVADGRLDKGGTFIADSLLAKHDENYVPRELKDIDMNAAKHTKDSLAK
jgi:cytochrome c-type biogenesis protein CcmE